jgi:hypothetical protein
MGNMLINRLISILCCKKSINELMDSELDSIKTYDEEEK